MSSPRPNGESSTSSGRAERFYGEGLGLPHLFTFGDLTFFDCGGVRLFLRAVPADQWRPSSILSFRTEAIDADFRAMEAAGVTTKGQPHLIHRHAESGEEEWMAFFADPDGDMLALMARSGRRRGLARQPPQRNSSRLHPSTPGSP